MNQPQTQNQSFRFQDLPTEMRLKLWKEAFNHLLQGAMNIHHDGELIGVQLQLHSPSDHPLTFNACYEAREQMNHLLFKNQTEIKKRGDVDIGFPPKLQVSCCPSSFLAAQILNPFSFFTSSIVSTDASTRSLFCFLPEAFSQLHKISFLPETRKRQGTSVEKDLLRDRDWPLRCLTYILRNLESFPSLEEIEIQTKLYPELWVVPMIPEGTPLLLLGGITRCSSDTQHFLVVLDKLFEEAKERNPLCNIPSIKFFF